MPAVKKIISFLIRHVPRTYLQSFSGIALGLAKFFLKGDQVFCDICGNQYRRFLPYGRLRVRANALCPGCLSLERHRLIQIFLTKHTAFYQKKFSVLHIAPERCFTKSFRHQHGSGYVTADLESPWADVQMDIHRMPFEENHFDVVICNHVLEHVKDDLLALNEIRRVLKKGGWAILQVPFFSPVPDKTFEDNTVTNKREREKLFGQSDHIRRYGKDYANRIERCGLRVKEERFAFDLPLSDVQKFGIVPEIIFQGVKD